MGLSYSNPVQYFQSIYKSCTFAKYYALVSRFAFVANVKRQSSAFNKAKKIFLLILFSLLLSFEVFSVPVSYDAKLSVENAVLNLSCSRVKGFLCKITKLSGILLANILLFFFSVIHYSLSSSPVHSVLFIIFIFFCAGYLKKICES